MIENLFLHFKTKDAFTAQLENISEDSIVFIQDSKEVYTHGQYYSCSVDLSVVDDEIKSFIVQELGQNTNKVPSQKLVEDTINTVTEMISGLTTVVEGEKGKLEALTAKVTEIKDVTIPGINESITSTKDTIDNYTVNGHKISENPVLDKNDVGLGNVDNTSDLEKPISTATQAALDEITSSLESHTSDESNPHNVTKDQVGLGNVTNDAQVKRSEMGVASGVATLGEDGKVPSVQLPSYVDDVIEMQKVVAAKANIPVSGLTVGQIFYATAEKKLFAATSATAVDGGTTPEAGKIYIAVADGNKQYRWGGNSAGLVQITSGNLVIGEVAGTAYDGLKGKQNRDAITSLPATIASEVKDVTQAADKVTIGIKVATKSGLNYGSPAAANIDIPAAATGKAGVMTGAQVDALTKAINDIVGLSNKTVNGHKISENPVLNGADVALTGFSELGEEVVNEALKPVATDTVNQAVAKLLKAILDNEEVVSASFAKLIKSVGLDEHLGYIKKPDGYIATDIAGVLTEADAKIKTLEKTKSDYEAFKAQFDWYEGE